MRFLRQYPPGIRGFAVTLACMLGAFSAALTYPQTGQAAGFPPHAAKMIVPYTPGGTTDALARVIANELAKKWQASVVVENRPGATGTIGIEQVARSNPDGHTLGMAGFGNILVANAIYPQLRYDVVADLIPVVEVATPPVFLIANASLPFNDVMGLIAYAKAHPGELHYGSSGTGSSNHLFGELFASMTGISMVHVPYKGSGPAVTDTLSGVIELNFAPYPLIKEHVGGDRIKVLGVTSAERSPALPDVPTIAEAGVPGYEALSWFGVVVPAGTPGPILARLNTDINDILQNQDVKRILASEGAVPTGGSLQKARASVLAGTQKWGDLVRRLGLHN